MAILIWLAAGALLGWIASVSRRITAKHRLIFNVAAGMLGALLSGFAVSPVLGIGTLKDGISIATIAASVFGAVLLIATVNFFRLDDSR